MIDELREDLAARDAALEEARREATDARAARREFLAAMTHELRTPLNAILGFGQVLDMSSLDEDQRDSLRQVLKGGRHLLRLVHELLKISHLLSNAIRFNHPRGRVAVRVSLSDGGLVRVAVSDTGPGLSPDQVARLFAPFERLEATNDGIEGTGLGLTLCRGLVRRMGRNRRGLDPRARRDLLGGAAIARVLESEMGFSETLSATGEVHG